MGIETALIATAVIGAASSVMGGIEASRQADIESDIAKRNAQQARVAAEQSRQEAQERADISREATEKLRSRQLTGFLKSGVRLEGTPLEVLAETERLGEEDVQSILRGGEARAQEYGSQAANYELQGKAAQSSGRSKFISGIGGAANIATQAFAGAGGK